MNFFNIFVNRLYSKLQNFGVELAPDQFEELKAQLQEYYEKYIPERFRKNLILSAILAFLVPFLVSKLVDYIMSRYVDTDGDGEPDPDEVLEALGKLLKKEKPL